MACRANGQLRISPDIGSGDNYGRWCRQQPPAYFQQRFSLAIGQESEVPYADEAFGQHVYEESPQELASCQRHLLFLISVRIVLPPEGDVAVRNREDALIGNGHAVRIARQIFQDLLGASERWFGIDNPLAAVGLVEERVEIGLLA